MWKGVTMRTCSTLLMPTLDLNVRSGFSKFKHVGKKKKIQACNSI